MTRCPQEGKARIAAYATPTKIEDWAGLLAGPTELERDFGVARSTLHTWHKQRAIIGLLVGVRKHVLPTEQFVDGRPLTGLGAVVEAIGDQRTAWLWLREPNPGLNVVTPWSASRPVPRTRSLRWPSRTSPRRDPRSEQAPLSPVK